MFILDQKEHIEWPVVARAPVSGGTVREDRFTVRFSTGPVPEERDEMEFIRKVVVGWGDDIRFSEGEPFPFSPENLNRLLLFPFVRLAILNAYHKMMTGIPEEVEKN